MIELSINSKSISGSTQGLYWLSPPTVERGGLSGMPCPGEAELARLPELGIGLVVSLLESYHPSSRLPSGLRRVRLPITDNGAPAEEHFELVVRLCALIHQFRRQPGPRRGVAIHCLHGRGRTGTILAAYRAYVAARWKDDPEAHAPTSTLPEINRLLSAAHGVSLSALGLEQTRWVAHFYQRMKRGIDPCWESSTAVELGWQWEEANGFASGSAWTCGDCGMRVSSPQPALEAPIWCPACGWATGQGLDD